MDPALLTLHSLPAMHLVFTSRCGRGWDCICMNERGREGWREGVDRFSQLVCFLCGKFESGGWREEGGRSGKHVSWQPRVPHASTSHNLRPERLLTSCSWPGMKWPLLNHNKNSFDEGKLSLQSPPKSFSWWTLNIRTWRPRGRTNHKGAFVDGPMERGVGQGWEGTPQQQFLCSRWMLE